MERFESENEEKGEMQLAKRKPIQTPEPLEELLEKAIDHLNKNGDLDPANQMLDMKARRLMEVHGWAIFRYGCIQLVWRVSPHGRIQVGGAARQSHDASGKKEKQKGLRAGLVLSRMN